MNKRTARLLSFFVCRPQVNIGMTVNCAKYTKKCINLYNYKICEKICKKSPEINGNNPLKLKKLWYN